MQAEDPFLLTDVSRDLANLVPGFIKIEVKDDELHRDYTILVHTADGRVFSSRVLSDGTLRLLTLITLVNDPDHHGVLYLEEPKTACIPSACPILLISLVIWQRIFPTRPKLTLLYGKYSLILNHPHW